MTAVLLALMIGCGASPDGDGATGGGDGGTVDGGGSDAGVSDGGTDGGTTVPATTVDTDVLIIGSGPAGMAAAWEAHQTGVGVIVLERDDAPGGSGYYARHLIAAGTRWQAEKAVADSPDVLLLEWAEFTSGGDPNDPWVQALAFESAGIVDWLVDELGATVLDVFIDTAAGSTMRMHIVEAEDGLGPVHVLVEAVGELAWTQVEATALRTDGKGQVTGAFAEDLVTGERFEIRAPATVVATGGFARDLDRVFDARPELDGAAVVYEAGLGSDGGGHGLLEDVAAASQNLENHGVYLHSAADPRDDFQGEAIIIDRLEASIIVDNTGRRVANESMSFGFVLASQLATAPDKRLWAVMPAPVFDESEPMAMGAAFGFGDEGENIDSFALEELGVAVRAVSTTAVGDLTDIDPDGLEDSLDRYAELIILGEDLDYGKRAEAMVPFEGGDLIVLELAAGSAKSFGGAWLDEQAQVRDTNGEVIPGLLAAGEAAGMLGTPGVGTGFSGSVTACYLTGRVAGRRAAELAGAVGR